MPAPRTYISAADLSAKQHYIAKVDSDGKAALASAATDAVIGTIVDGGNASGEAVSIAGPECGGFVKSGGTIGEGDLLTTDSSGLAVATTTDGNAVFGIALEAADANDVIRWAPAPGRIYIA